MPARHCSITEAALCTGVARTTIQRWLKAGRLKKRKGGTVSLAAVGRCMSEHHAGRPCGVRHSWGVKSAFNDCTPFEPRNFGRYETLADKLAKPLSLKA